MSKVALLDLGKYQNEQGHKVSWAWLKKCRHGAQILGSMGHNGPCPCGIGLKTHQELEKNFSSTKRWCQIYYRGGPEGPPL